MLKLYKASFFGCTKGAIGIHYPITTYITAADPKMAELHLYELYEHMQNLKLEEQPEMAEQPFSPNERGIVATVANGIGKISRRPGAPTLDFTSDKDTLVRWLYWCDGNGSWDEDDEHAVSLDEAWFEVYKMVTED